MQGAAENLRSWGWRLNVDMGTRLNGGRLVLRAQRGDTEIVVTADDLNAAMEQAERQARSIAGQVADEARLSR